MTSLPGFYIHCLVVEDNLVNQRVLAKGLQGLGCTVQVANHGKEALDVITGSDSYRLNVPAKRQAVVLMDWEMPVMDGLTCVKKVREWEGRQRPETGGREKSKRLPVIGVTANARSQQIAEAMEAGMDDVVSKPFRVPELLERIAKLLEGWEKEGGEKEREEEAGKEGEKADG